MEKIAASEKNTLRIQYKAHRSDIPPHLHQEWSHQIAAHVLNLPKINAAHTIFAYLSRSGEVSTPALVTSFLQMGKRVFTPSPDIRALPHHGLFKLNIQPEGSNLSKPVFCNEISVDQLDVILVPGIVWDRSGYRIGFGGGYFDRLLETARPDCLKVGLAFDSQVVDSVPREPWDQNVDVLVTQSGAFTA